MRFAAMIAVLAGCGVNIDGQGGVVIDASAPRIDDAADAGAEVDAGAGAGLDAGADAAVGPIDARVCSGGDAHAGAPDGSCFVLFKTPQTWLEAEASCAAIGAHPAILPSAAMDTAAEALVGNRDTFIGLTDEASEGAFVWVDGSALVFANFASGEPNNGGGGGAENCVVIAGSRAGKKWDDRPCVAGGGDGRYAVLCQQ
jgi:hypothetical protein